MSCRSVPATSAATTFAYLNCDLNEQQTLSAFHALRAEAPRNTPSPTEAEYREFLATERNLVLHHPNLTEARRASLLGRIDRATSGPVVDGRTFYAMRRIRSFTQAQSRELQAQYASLADRLGVPVGRVRSRAAELARQVPPTRSGQAPAGYTPVAVAQFRASRLPVDRGTIHALTTLETEAVAAGAARQPRTPQNRRVRLVDVSSAAIARMGYDPDGGRLEVVFRSNEDRVYAYRNVPAHVWSQMKGASAGRAWHEHIRGRAEYRYPTDEAAEQDAYRLRCARCGQFAASTHTCPHPSPGPAVSPRVNAASVASPEDVVDTDRVTTVTSEHLRAFMAATVAAQQERVTDVTQPAQVAGQPVQARSIDHLERDRRMDPETGLITLAPPARVVRAETASGPVMIRYRHWGTEGEEHDGETFYQLVGRVVYARDDDGTLTVDTSGLRCICQQYLDTGHCPHIDAHHTALLRHVNPLAARERDVARAQAQVEEALRSDWMASKLYASQAKARVAESPVRYVDDPDAFEADAARAAADAAAGRDPVGYVLDNATDGLLSRESGRGFGVEIEFNFPASVSEDAREDALRRIGEDLYAEGLTSTPVQREYHSQDAEGYTDEHEGGWSFEEDQTVAGEVVSPIMYDEPQTWQNLAKVCEIVKRHGGVADISTGSHVHVGAGDFGSDPGPLTELTRLANAHEDVLYRMSSNPDSERGHRSLRYCAPTALAPIAGYTTISQAVNAHSGHDMGINLQSVQGADSDHVEFRHWDGTLNPSVIQAQVKMSAAMTVAAKRISDTHGSAPRPREPIGAHLTRAKAARGEQRPVNRVAETASTRAFIDTLFTRPEDKAQMAALFAITRWQPRHPGRATQDQVAA